MTITDPNGIITYTSNAFCALSGYEKEEVLGNSHKIIRHPDMPEQFFQLLWNTVNSQKIWRGKIKCQTKDKETFIVRTKIVPVVQEGKIKEFIAIRHDVTHKDLASIDALTGLENRRVLDIELSKTVQKTLMENSTVLILILDIDYFKKINDTYGHKYGDKILKSFAKVLKSSVRKGDKCFRFGGEEFVVLFCSITLDEAEKIAKKIQKNIKKSVILKCGNGVECSIGLTQFRTDDKIESFFERADALLYRAKQEGRNRVVSG